jgi:hypothetical protein
MNLKEGETIYPIEFLVILILFVLLACIVAWILFG